MSVAREVNELLDLWEGIGWWYDKGVPGTATGRRLKAVLDKAYRRQLAQTMHDFKLQRLQEELDSQRAANEQLTELLEEAER